MFGGAIQTLPIQKMEKFFNVLQLMLKPMGLDIFSKRPNKHHLLIRAIYIVASLLLMAALFFTSFDSENDFADLLLKCLYNLGGTIIFIQVVEFLKNKSDMLDLSIWLKDSYTERNSIFVGRYSNDRLMERYKMITINLVK